MTKLKKLLKKKPQLTSIYKDLLIILEIDPYENSILLQPLYGELKEFNYIDLTLNYKLILHIKRADRAIYLIDVGKKTN